MNTAARLIQDLELEERFDDLVLACPDKIPLIDEGNYDAIALACRRERRFRRDLLAFKFHIVSQGAAFGVVLPGYCNLDFGRGRGRQLPARSKLAVWLRRINAFAPEVSCKRVHLTTFGKFQFIVRVATSRGTVDHPLPTNEHYSQVTELLEVIGRITSRGSGV
jgi:hypothetical protein